MERRQISVQEYCAASPEGNPFGAGRCCENGYFGQLHTCAKQPGSSLRMDYGFEVPMELSPSEVRVLKEKLKAAEEQIKLLTELRDCWKERALLAENPLREAK